MAAADVATYYALALGVTGIVGTVVSGWLADKLGQKDRRWFAWIPAIAFTLVDPVLVRHPVGADLADRDAVPAGPDADEPGLSGAGPDGGPERRRPRPSEP